MRACHSVSIYVYSCICERISWVWVRARMVVSARPSATGPQITMLDADAMHSAIHVRRASARAEYTALFC